MKAKWCAYLLLIVIIDAVTVNTIAVDRVIARTAEEVLAVTVDPEGQAETAIQPLEDAYTAFRRRERFINLTVSHEDLTHIESDFAECIGAAMAGDTEQVIITKNRLLDALRHLRRLSGFNPDSIL